MNLIVRTKLTQQDYIEVSYHLYYRKLPLKLVTGLGFFMIVTGIGFIFWEFNPWVLIIFGLYLTVGMRFFIYYGAKQSYQANTRGVREPTVYNIDKSIINVSGESFNSIIPRTKVYGITETKDFVFIWQNKSIPYCLPKRDLTVEEIETLMNWR